MVDLAIRGVTDLAPLYKAKALDPIKPPLLLPEVIDESKWWGGKHLYKDEEKQHILATDLSVLTSFAYNTKLVDPNEIKSYWDFLNPKWKGKILLLEPGSGGTGTSHIRRVEGTKYLVLDDSIDTAPITKFVNEVWKRKS